MRERLYASKRTAINGMWTNSQGGTRYLSGTIAEQSYFETPKKYILKDSNFPE